MSLGFPLSILWSRQGIGIYPDSAEGSITLSIPRYQVSASQKLLHPPADKQKCGLENNNKRLVDRIKVFSAEVRGFEFYYHSWINHRFSAWMLLFTRSGTIWKLLLKAQRVSFIFNHPPKVGEFSKTNTEELKSTEKQKRGKEWSCHLHTLWWWCAHCCWWRTGRCSCSLGDKSPWNQTRCVKKIS